jgi:hypothetical protein
MIIEDLILDDLEPVTFGPRDILLDDFTFDEYTPAVTARFYWRFEDEPEAEYQYLGQQTVGSPFQVPFDNSGRDIRISMISSSSGGVFSKTDARAGVQIVLSANDLFGIVTHEGVVVTHEGPVVEYNG